MNVYCPHCLNEAEEFAPCPSCGNVPGDYTAAPHHLPPGTVLRDRYRLGAALGEGGFGITYLALDTREKRLVAVKEYFPLERATRYPGESQEVQPFQGDRGVGFEQGREKFLEEAQTLASLAGVPHILHVLDCFPGNNTAYIVMEYVRGPNLCQWVELQGGNIPADEVFLAMRGLFDALSRIHGLGLIHRDISPENMILENGRIRLLDFGCAREPSRRTETFTLTLHHGYAPVEQYQPMGQGPYTDVYALSATMYYCITGKHPPHALERLFGDTLEPPHTLGLHIDPRQEQVLLYGLGVRPRRRFQSVEAMARALYGE